jgi:hypothetical protein
MGQRDGTVLASADASEWNTSHLEYTTMSSERIGKLASVFGGVDKVKQVLAEFTTPLPRPFPTLPAFRQASTHVNGTGLENINSSDSADSCSVGSTSTQTEEEEVVVDIVNRRKKDGVYEWRVVWISGDRTWEKKEAFVDSDTGNVNALWKKYEETHRYKTTKNKV